MTLAKEFLKFVDASPSPFHAVESCISRLRSAGFTEIKEAAVWTTRTAAAAANDSNQCAILPGGKYFFTRNKSAIIAFCVGGRYAPSSGFSIIGAHTDSPCLKVKPRSKREKSACVQVGVELYGGGLWHTWFDRDLSVAGRVLVREAAGSEEAHTYSHRLVKIDKALLRIPTLAIHLDRSSNDGFTFNKEVQLTPILAMVQESLSKKDQGSDVGTLHHPMLLKELASDMNVDVANICDFELCLYDTQPASIGGANGEFIHTARLDNLMMSYCALNAIIDSNDSLLQDTKIRVVALFDNEEVGSQTAHGANSNFMEVTLRRLSEMDIGASAEAPAGARYERSMVNSLLISADMAHALHPNYSEKHEDNHRPLINQGVVVKQNANQRYATTAVSTLILREAARKAAGGAVPLQEFVVRNDSPCGSTIGPMLSSSLGVRTVDVGNPQWSMHSIRETCGVTDVDYAVNLFKSFFDNFADIDSRIPRL
ncbi:hypothetical protein BASA60_000016 [Batrachochytrium salamandrivorans]|nr:hypothetical protein BASA60_000016 [Batrachochytrium salamandrivorans]